MFLIFLKCLPNQFSPVIKNLPNCINFTVQTDITKETYAQKAFLSC